MSTQVAKSQIIELRKPIPLKWRVSRAIPNKSNPTHVIMVGYIDSRDVQNRLDEVLGAENWQTKYFECKGKQFCEIGIKINGEWVWKGDNGEESMTSKGKGETSDSFKRAAVHWGINRFAYQVGEVKLNCKLYGDKPFPTDDKGNFLKGKKLYDVCNELGKIDELEVEFDKHFFESHGNTTNQAKPTSQDISKQRFKDYLSSKLNKDTVDALSDEELQSLENFVEILGSYENIKSVQLFAKSKTFSELEKELIRQRFEEFKK